MTTRHKLVKLLCSGNKSKSGQATVEFALTVTLLIAFVFFFLQLALVFAWGNYIHYATFMSARAYLSAGVVKGDQVERAKSVITRSIKKGSHSPGRDRLPTIAKGIGGLGDVPGLQLDPPGQFNAKARAFSWLEGVRYTFRTRLFLIPFAGSSKQEDKGIGVNSSGNINKVELTSESWLGREPNYSECKGYLDDEFETALIDNGC